MQTRKRPVICWATIDWGFLLHRPQQLMLFLARQGHPVYYRNPGQIPGSAPEEVAPNLWVYPDYDRLPPGVAEEAIYFVYFPAWATWIEPNIKRFIVYDCLDDDPAFAGHEKLMLERADLVFCCSQKLMEKHHGKHSRLVLLPNGVDLEHYRPQRLPDPLEMRDIRSQGEIVVGFTGAFYTGWVDAKLLYYLAVERPEWQFVIVGHNYQWDFSAGPYKAPPNMSYLGIRPYAVLPAYVQCFDVGLIPFLDNPVSRAADPIKMYEYLGAGLPVVSRNLPFLQGLAPPMVYPYDDKEGCLAAITQALQDEQANRDEVHRMRRDSARSFSWDVRFGLLYIKLRELTWLE